MKKILLFLILSTHFLSFAQQNDKAASTTDSQVFSKVDVESAYPGGLKNWNHYLINNMHYPPKAIKKNIQGTVIVQFIIDEEGNVSSVEAIEGPELLKKEAVRLIKASGKWIPGQQNGKPAKTYKKQPFIFKLKNDDANHRNKTQLLPDSHTRFEPKQTDSASFATVVFYRAYIPKMNAPVKKVPIYINDTLVYSLKANTVFTKNIYSEGRYNISIDKKGETTLPLKIKFGTSYFFKCDVAPGIWFGKPVIREVSADIGEAECGVLEAKTARNNTVLGCWK